MGKNRKRSRSRKRNASAATAAVAHVFAGSIPTSPVGVLDIREPSAPPSSRSGRSGLQASGEAYDATNTDGKKRRAISSNVQNEDKKLNRRQRRELQEQVLNAQRNLTILAWMVRKVLDYNTSFSFQGATADKGLNKRLEKYIKKRSRAGNFDVSGRMNRDVYTRTLEGARLQGGVGFSLKMSDGSMQGLESDMINLPTTNRIGKDMPDDVNPVNYPHGTKYDKFGKAISHILCSRDGSALAFERVVPAENVLIHQMYMRFSQGRGVSELTPALNAALDLYDTIGAYTQKAKLIASVGLIVTSGTGEEMAFASASTPTNPDEAGTPTAYEYDLDGKPFTMQLAKGDDMKMVESNTPPQEFLNFVETLIRIMLMSCDIPYTFYDQTRGSFTIQKDAWTQWEIASRPKRERVKNWLNRWTVWQMQRGIANGEVELPGDMTLEDVEWHWLPAGRPWMDTKELDIAINSMASLLQAPQAIYAEKGVTMDEVLDGHEELIAGCKKRGIPWEQIYIKVNKSLNDQLEEVNEDAAAQQEGTAL